LWQVLKVYNETKNNRNVSVTKMSHHKWQKCVNEKKAGCSVKFRPSHLPGWWCHRLKMVVREGRTPSDQFILVMMTSLAHRR